MQVSVETTQGLGRKLTLGIPAEQIDSEVEKRVADTAKRVRLDGFRPGKVPKKVVKQRFGDSLRAEVVGDAVNKSFQDAITQESLKPVGTPTFDFVKNTSGEDLEIVATFEVFPEIELKDPSELKLEKMVAEVTDSDVDAVIEKLRDQRAEWIEVERKAKDGDQLNIDFLGTKDGEEFQGGSAEGVDLILGSKQMIEGFESGLIGTQANDKKELALTFPADYDAEELAGEEALFKITVNVVKEKSLPALDQQFFAAFEVDGGLDEFKAKVRDNMVKQLADSIENNLKNQVMDGLVEQNEVELPAALIAQEVDAMRSQSIERMGMKAEDFDASLLPNEMFEEQAKKRVALGVILNQFVTAYEIKPDREKLIEFIDEIAESYDDPDEVRNLYLSDESRLQQVGLVVMEKLAVEKVVDLAGCSEKSCSYDDVMASAAAVSGQS